MWHYPHSPAACRAAERRAAIDRHLLLAKPKAANRAAAGLLLCAVPIYKPCSADYAGSDKPGIIVVFWVIGGISGP